MKPRSRTQARRKRHLRLRRKVSGTAERPRMAIMVSDKHMYVQFIDDETGSTMAAASTVKTGIKRDVEGAKALAQRAAEAAKGKSISRVVVDRGGFKFHGRVKAIVDTVNEAGISICGNEKQTD